LTYVLSSLVLKKHSNHPRAKRSVYHASKECKSKLPADSHAVALSVYGWPAWQIYYVILIRSFMLQVIQLWN